MDRITNSPTDRTGDALPATVTPGVTYDTTDSTSNESEDTDLPETPPRLRDAIATIENYSFTPPTRAPEPGPSTEDESLALLMMFNSRAATELPQLHTDTWPYNGKKPNPISVSKARRLLATAYAAVPCEITGTGEHGYAWMIETETEWNRREGTERGIKPPTKPEKENDYDIKKRLAYADKMEEYKLYNHLVQAGRAKIVTWFGKALFVDLHVNNMLPVTTTPTDLIAHLTATYCQGSDNRRYMEQVERNFNVSFDQKQPVETYFMKLQDAQYDAELLGQPYTETQMMNKALAQFEKSLGSKEAYKAEKRWNTKEDRTWTTFKAFWKDEMHQWDTVRKAGKEAHEVSTDEFNTLAKRFDAMQMDMTALQVENRSVYEANNALMARHSAMQTEQQHSNSGDEGSIVSALTDYMSGMERRLVGLNANANYNGGTTTTTDSTRTRDTRSKQQLLELAKRRAPDCYKHLNDGRGKPYARYCWHCGVNVSHSTRGCYELTDELKNRYKDATFTNTMGGSTKFLERRDKYQADYNFDSL